MPVPSTRTMMRARALVNSSLTTPCVILETGQETTCRIAATRYDDPITGAPESMKFRRWRVTLPDGTAVSQGKTVRATGLGDYVVTGSLSPNTISASTAVAAILVAAPDNYMIVTDQVSFRQRVSDELLPATGTVGVTIIPISYEERAKMGTTNFTDEVIWDDTLTFADGQPIGEGDFIVWSRLADKEAGLYEPRRYSAVHQARAYFRDR